MNKIEHIGIAVSSLQEAIPLFEALLNTPCYKMEEVESEKVKTAFFQNGPNNIELLESTDPDGVIAKYIAKKGVGKKKAWRNSDNQDCRSPPNGWHKAPEEKNEFCPPGAHGFPILFDLD